MDTCHLNLEEVQNHYNNVFIKNLTPKKPYNPIFKIILILRKLRCL